MSTAQRAQVGKFRRSVTDLLGFFGTVYGLLKRVLQGPYGWVVRVVIAVGLLIAVMSRIDLEQLWSVITSLSPVIIVLALVLNLFGWVVNSYKWQQLLASYGISHSLDGLIRLNLVANFFSKALPGQVTGEVLKAVRLSGSTRQQQAIFASIFLDRVTGLIGLAVLGAPALLISPPPFLGVAGMAPVLLGLLAIAIGGAAYLVLPTTLSKSDRWKSLLPSRYFRYIPAFLSFADSEGRRPTLRQLGVALLLGTIFQSLIVFMAWLLAYDAGVNVSPAVSGWIMSILAVGYLLPISIAGLGVREGLLVGLLGLYSVPSNQALTISLVVFAIEMTVGLLGGVLNLFGRATTIGN